MSKNPLALLEKDTWFAHISGIRTYIRVIYCKSAQFIQFTVNPGWFAMLFAYFQLPRGPWAVSALFGSSMDGCHMPKSCEKGARGFLWVLWSCMHDNEFFFSIYRPHKLKMLKIAFFWGQKNQKRPHNILNIVRHLSWSGFLTSCHALQISHQGPHPIYHSGSPLINQNK